MPVEAKCSAAGETQLRFSAYPVADARFHDRVVRRMKLHLADTAAIAVVCVQNGSIAVGLTRQVA